MDTIKNNADVIAVCTVWAAIMFGVAALRFFC